MQLQCLICNKYISQIEPRENNIIIGIWNDAATIEITGGYGSHYDTTMLHGVMCDNCISKNLHKLRKLPMSNKQQTSFISDLIQAIVLICILLVLWGSRDYELPKYLISYTSDAGKLVQIPTWYVISYIIITLIIIVLNCHYFVKLDGYMTIGGLIGLLILDNIPIINIIATIIMFFSAYEKELQLFFNTPLFGTKPIKEPRERAVNEKNRQ